QAEDGIRDFHVTGVQTCALPISPKNPMGEQAQSGDIKQFARPFSPALLDEALSGDAPVFVEMTAAWCITCKVNHASSINIAATRSEERRVGKECRQWECTGDRGE